MYGGYVGLGAGASRYDLRSGSGGFDFDDGGSAIKLYAGAFFHPNLGLELGYLDLGKARRIGGNSSARGTRICCPRAIARPRPRSLPSPRAMPPTARRSPRARASSTPCWTRKA